VAAALKDADTGARDGQKRRATYSRIMCFSRPVVAAVGAPIVEGVTNVFAGEDFGEAIGGAGIFPLAGARGDVNVARG